MDIKAVLNDMFDNGLDDFITKFIESGKRVMVFEVDHGKFERETHYLYCERYSNSMCSNIEIYLCRMNHATEEILEQERLVLYDTCNDAWDSFYDQFTNEEKEHLSQDKLDKMYDEQYNTILISDVSDILASYCFD